MGWAPVVTAIATAMIALIVVGFVIAALPLLRQASRTAKAVERFIISFETESKPLLENAKSVVSEANQLAVRVRSEVDGVLDTSREIRTRVRNAAEAAEERLIDLEALLDVLQDEMEETVLDVAAALRTTRRGTTILRSMKRAFLGPGKKKRRRKR